MRDLPSGRGIMARGVLRATRPPSEPARLHPRVTVLVLPAEGGEHLVLRKFRPDPVLRRRELALVVVARAAFAGEALARCSGLQQPLPVSYTHLTLPTNREV